MENGESLILHFQLNQSFYFFRQIAATNTPLLRIEIVGTGTDIFHKTKRKTSISK